MLSNIYYSAQLQDPRPRDGIVVSAPQVYWPYCDYLFNILKAENLKVENITLLPNFVKICQMIKELNTNISWRCHRHIILHLREENMLKFALKFRLFMYV
jgi:hypothetical protein